jgi:NAD(P)-dependent dehydrogenase (short-subunit alcohol dehydrogenase family)
VARGGPGAMSSPDYPGPWTGVVAGGSSGIGFACAKRLVEAGGHVVLAGIDANEVHSAVKELSGRGDVVRGFTGDLSEPVEARSLLEVAAGVGPVKVVVNSVGFQRYGTAEST